MTTKGINLSNELFCFFKKNLSNDLSLVNSLIFRETGIKLFFESNTDLIDFTEIIETTEVNTSEIDRAEFGDFQTPPQLCSLVCRLLKAKQIKPQVVIEPTCGKGSFILSILEYFPDVEKIIGIEIYPKYILEAKLSILSFFIENPERTKPEIQIINANIFEFNFDEISIQCFDKDILILGNPPWVTNSMLGTLNSKNLPSKKNFKKNRGLDAITGKGNFDLAESICYTIFQFFSKHKGCFAFLQKNSVIKNILNDQFKNKFTISEIEKYNFDAKKEFNVATDASLFYCRFNSHPQMVCNEFDLYDSNILKSQMGWFRNKFVSNILEYTSVSEFDQLSPFIWRQGIKHDCSKIMELQKNGVFYRNKNNDLIEIEDELVYPFLKSSDLNSGVVETSRMYTIVTQSKIGDDTAYIAVKYPKLYHYLYSNIDHFNKRKSSIYTNKPFFSIFGVGEYSFKKYKVAISGFYKSTNFALLLPFKDKTMQLDDTCYFIGFDVLIDAVYTYIILSHKITQDLLSSIVFFDSKRPITKDILMRINLVKIADAISFHSVVGFYNLKINNLQLNLNNQNWLEYKESLKTKQVFKQLDLFSTEPI